VFGVPQDVLSQLFGLFSFVVDPSRRLFAALLVYAAVPVPILVLLRRVSLLHTYRLTSLRGAFRRIWTTLRRRPRQAGRAAVRLVEETGANPVTAALCWLAAAALSLLWWLAVVDGLDSTGFRTGLGQRRPVMFGVPLTPSVGWSVDSDHVVLLTFAACFVLTPVLLGHRFRMVHAAINRRRGRPVPPWYADVRFVLGFSVCLVTLIIGDFLLWARVALLIGIATEAAVSAVVVRTVRLDSVTAPGWVAQLASPPRATGRTRRLGLPWRAPAGSADDRSVAGRPAAPAAGQPARRRVTVEAAEPRVSATSRLATSMRRLFSRSDGSRSPDAWASYAPALGALMTGDPRRIGAYTVHGRLGSGGMSVVYAGTHRTDRRDVAIKVMRDVLDDAEAQGRLLREMEALAQATGPHTVQIVTVGHESLDGGGVGHFLVMERLFGPNLWDFVHRCGPIVDPAALTHLAVVLGAGLSDFHSRAVTHRDLKPANVVLTDTGPVIVDLGIAKLADVTATLPGSQAFATLGYVAPETILGRAAMAPADVWSWGCCLVYAASGQRLFPGDSWDPVAYAILNGRRNLAALEAVRRVSPPLADLVWAATEVEPARRPGNGSALLARLPADTHWPSPSRALGGGRVTQPDSTEPVRTMLHS
jgi:Protein kinase domain